MSFRRDLYERVMHQKDFGKVKNKIYDILGWFVDYSMSTVIAMEFPIGKGFFETIARTYVAKQIIAEINIAVSNLIFSQAFA